MFIIIFSYLLIIVSSLSGNLHWACQELSTYQNLSLQLEKTIIQKPFRCCQCSKSYSCKRNLSRHLQLECGRAPKYSCPFCAFKMKHKSSLIRHMKHKH